MASDEQPTVLCFGACEILLDRQELRRNGVVQPVTPQVFALLRYLAEHRDRLVEKDELIEHVWDGRVVSDSSLSTCVKLARQAIGDDGRKQTLIRTVPRRGYRFIGEVSAAGGATPQSADRGHAQEAAGLARGVYVLPDKPTLAVLRFDNLTGDAAQDHVCDGLTENVIAVLSSSPDLVVAARNSSFTFKDRSARIQNIAAVLGVRYVLEGSLQKSGDLIRVTAQLIDAEDDRHIWAERYDRKLENLFELQDAIAQQILLAINIKLTIGSDAQHIWDSAGSLDLYRQIVLARSYFQAFSPEGHREAERLIGDAHERFPDLAVTNQWMGWLYWQKVTLNLVEDHAAALDIARSHLERQRILSEAAGLEPRIYNLLGLVELQSRNFPAAIASADLGLQQAGSDGAGIALAGNTKLFAGQPVEGVELLQRGIEYEPDYPQWIPMSLTTGLMMQERFDEAKQVARDTLIFPVEDARANRAALQNIAAMASFEDDMDEARVYLDRLHKAFPTWSVSGVRNHCYFWKDQAFLKRLLAALEKAGARAQA